MNIQHYAKLPESDPSMKLITLHRHFNAILVAPLVLAVGYFVSLSTENCLSYKLSPSQPHRFHYLNNAKQPLKQILQKNFH